MVDIHSHILPCLDDGSSSVEESLELLRLMKKQGINKVFATPHFYPQIHNFEEFSTLVFESLNNLNDNIKFNSLPEIYLGSELLYFSGMGNSDSLSEFCFEGSSYLLLELNPNHIDNTLIDDLKKIIHDKHLNPILAHIERYFDCKNINKVLKFVKKENIPLQINAASVLEKQLYKDIKKLIKKDMITYIATDSHSLKERPPLMDKALAVLEADFGKTYIEKLQQNSNDLFNKIISETRFYAQNF